MVDQDKPTHYWPRALLAVTVWLTMMAWSHIPPYRGNILELKTGLFVWHWQLYSRGGSNICDVRYFDMNRDGEPIERWTLLGYDRPHAMDDKLARTHKKQLRTAYGQVCTALREAGDPAPHVEVSARCGIKGKWKQIERRKRNVCELGNKSKPKGASK